MMNDQGPPNGDFAAYIEALTHKGPLNVNVMHETRVETAANGQPLPTPLVASDALPSELIEILRRELGPLLSMAALAVMLLAGAAVVSGSIGAMLRLCAIAVLLFLAKRFVARRKPLLGALRSLLELVRKRGQF